MSKIILQDINSFQNDSTAVAATTANNTTLENAVTNSLSLDGTQPNSMNANLDMNSNRILNLPAAVTADEPMRLQDLANYATGGTVTLNNLPVGGTTGQFLAKNSNTNYDFSWGNVPVNQAVTSFNTNQGVVTYGLASTDFTVSNSNAVGTINLTAARKTLPTRQLLSTGSGTYTTPANCLYIKVTMAGGGGGGGGSGTTTGTASGTGGATTFSTFTAGGGGGGSGASTSQNSGGTGGAASGGTIQLSGAVGDSTGVYTASAGTLGGKGAQNAFFSGAGAVSTGVGGTAVINSGSGGSGGGGGTVAGGGGGGAGASLIGWINSPAATYSYSVGAGGVGGGAGASGNAGGAGGSGLILIEEFYNS